MNRQTVVKTIFGSHLYGLATENSDQDYKGIVLSTAHDILLGNTIFHVDISTGNQNSRNTANDTDETYYSLQMFINLACAGETVALDMLHAPNPPKYLNEKYSWVWDYLVTNRQKFYTRSMKSYLGYVRKQAAKYEVKGSRIATLEAMLSFLNSNLTKNTGWSGEELKVGDLEFPPFEHGFWIDHKGLRFYEFCGSKFQDNLRVDYMINTVQKILNRYGERAILAKENKGVDWKALSHALRAGYQLRDIYLAGDFEYPLKENPLLLQVKQGTIDFSQVERELADLVEQVSGLADNSNLPKEVDLEFWQHFVMTVHHQVILDSNWKIHFKEDV